MPGPNSAPNGDSRLVTDIVIRKDGSKIRLRDLLREKGTLRTGKTRK
jgi:hypothetical protein